MVERSSGEGAWGMLEASGSRPPFGRPTRRLPMSSPSTPPSPPSDDAELPPGWPMPSASPQEVAQTLAHELRTLVEPLALVADATPRGRPRILPSLALWAGLLVCVAQ